MDGAVHAQYLTVSRRRRSRALHHKALARDKRDSVNALPLEAPNAPASHVALVARSEDGALEAPPASALELANSIAPDSMPETNAADELTMTPPPVSTSTLMKHDTDTFESATSGVSEIGAPKAVAVFAAEEDPMPSIPPARHDEGSLPPMTSNVSDEDDVDEDTLFFAKKVVVEAEAEEMDVEDPAVRLQREAVERRAAMRRNNSRKYVAAVVGVCALLGGLGFSTRLLGKSTSVAKAPITAVVAAGGEQTQALMPLPAIELKAPAAQAPAPQAPVAQAAPAAPKADDVAHPDDVVIAPKEEPKVDAKAEKKAAQRSLETGKVADAIEHATASVTADETDAEAWLLLGASYQEKGQLAKARESFQSCMKLAKRGPKGECAAMLR